MDSQPTLAAQVREFLTTKCLAEKMQVLPQSIHHRYHKKGSYHGVRPVKLPNRFLAWPVDEVEQLLMRGQK